MHSNLAPAPRQRTCTSTVDTRSHDGPRKDPASWVNRIPSETTDARLNPGLGHRFGWMLLILEGYCRSRCYCWTSNAELFAAFGCSESTGQEILKAMEDAQIIHRVPAERGRHGRVGIILRRRLNPDLPTAGAEEIPDVIRLMRATIAERRERRRGRVSLPFPGPPSTRESGPSAPGNPGPSCTRKSGCGRKTLSLEEDDPENDGPEEESFQRQRPDPEPTFPRSLAPPPCTPLTAGPEQVAAAEPPAPRAEAPIAPPPPPVVAPAPAAPAPVAGPEPVTPAPARTGGRAVGQVGVVARLLAVAAPIVLAPAGAEAPAASSPALPLSVGQARFLALLDPGRRQRFDALPAAQRAELLAPHRLGFDRIIAKEQARKLSPRTPAAPPPPEPTLREELWEKLAEPGAPREWTHRAAGDLVRLGGTRKDREMWPAFLQVAELVWRGALPPAEVLDAIRQGMKGKNFGAVFNHVLQAKGVVWEGKRP